MISRLRIFPLFLLLVFFCLPAVLTSGGPETDPVIESFLLALREGGTSLEVRLNNRTSGPRTTRLQLQLLDTRDNVVAERDAQLDLLPGENEAAYRIPELDGLEDGDRLDLAWYRLRYRFSASGSGRLLASGYRTVADIAPDALALGLTAPGHRRPGESLTVMVNAGHPVTGVPAAGCRVEILIRDEDTEDVVASRIVTVDETGAVRATLEVPAVDRDADVELVVRARRGPFVEEQYCDLLIWQPSMVIVATDRPLYQPGDTVHYRVLAIERNRRALDGLDVELVIDDQQGTKRHVANGRTSDLGLFHGQWQIPEHAPPGEYDLDVEVMDQDGETVGERAIELEVSRYELPTMAVLAKTDRPYCFVGQDPAVTVTVTTLAGEPIRGARVEVVPDEQYGWFDHPMEGPDESAPVLAGGETGADGTWGVTLDGSALFEYDEKHWYDPYEDVPLAALVTDPDSGRTSFCRFAVRYTVEAVHVYMEEIADAAPELPMVFRVSTFRPDGEPVSCTGTIHLDENESPGIHLAEFTTDGWGLAEVELEYIDREDERLELWAVATAADSSTGRTSETIWGGKEQALRLRPGRFRFEAGESVPVTIQASPGCPSVWVSAEHEGELLWERVVELVDGGTRLEVPFHPRFRGEVTLRSFPSTFSTDDWKQNGGKATVLYPDPEGGLELSLQLEPGAAGPGEPVTARLGLKTRGGTSPRAVAGVAIVDTAIEELLAERGDPRARSFFRRASETGFNFWETTYAGLDRRDLPALPGPDEEYIRLAGLLLGWGPDERSVEGADPAWHTRRLYQRLIREMCADAMLVINQEINEGSGERSELVDPEHVLRKHGVDLSAIHDPWGRPIIAETVIRDEHRVLRLVSAGLDGEAGTADDIEAKSWSWRWFKEQGRELLRAVKADALEQGSWPLDEAAVIAALQRQGMDWDTLRDPFGHRLRIRVSTYGQNLYLSVLSPRTVGRNGVHRHRGEDCTVWHTHINTFHEVAGKIEEVLEVLMAVGWTMPASGEGMREVLLSAGLKESELADLDGVHYRFEPSVVPVFSDAVQLEHEEVKVTPIKGFEARISVRYAGRDGINGTKDDGWAGVLSVPLSGDWQQPDPGEGTLLAQAAGIGAISGTVMDENGVPLPGVMVIMTTEDGSTTRKAVSDAEGRFTAGVPVGTWSVRFEMDGFGTAVRSHLVVEEWRVIHVNAALGEYQGVLGEITVMAAAPVIQTTTTSVGESVDTRHAEYGRATGEVDGDPSLEPADRKPMSTPRLRRDFPETMLWVPDLKIGWNGIAELEFELADAVTTWNVQAVVSTADGRLVTAEAPLVSAMPFYVDLEHPLVLTSGDRLDLPAVVRNFTDTTQQVSVEMAAEEGLEVSGARRATVVAAGEAEPVRFEVLAVGAAEDAALRVTALGEDKADAVERRLAVVPDGDCRQETVSALLSAEAELTLEVPEAAMPGSARARLVVFPGFGAQLAATIDGINRRPTGCAEQISSAAWLRVVRLHYLQQAGITEGPRVDRDRQVLAIALERLDRVQGENGGFFFWRGGEPRVGLTAHVLRFLLAAEPWVDVDQRMIRGAAEWLAKQQTANGTWQSAWVTTDSPHDVQLTAAVFRALAAAAGHKGAPDLRPHLARTIAFLQPALERFPEPHALATFALGCRDLGREELLDQARPRLAAAARSEGPLRYWHLQSNSPLGGWGLPGQLETTALAVQVLASGGERYEQLVNDGSRYLLSNKDRYGVWWSTLSTVTALEALLASPLAGGTTGGTLTVLVDGELRATVDLPTGPRALVPIPVDLGDIRDPGKKTVRLERTGGDTQIAADLQVSCCLPWPEESDRADSVRQGNLLFAVTFDRRDVAAGETVRCSVHAERVAHRGYGMLLVEVGLPPGAVVDRLALEKELGSRFEIRPDRVVLYLWARPGGSDVELQFKPRFSGDVVSAPSQLYDYYNPEAGVTLPPQRFVFSRSGR